MFLTSVTTMMANTASVHAHIYCDSPHAVNRYSKELGIRSLVDRFSSGEDGRRFLKPASTSPRHRLGVARCYIPITAPQISVSDVSI
jgi:hypothetical protein